MLDKKNFYINGKWVKPSKSNDFEVINPSNEEPFAVISLGSREDTDAAVKAALRDLTRHPAPAMSIVSDDQSHQSLIACADPSTQYDTDEVSDDLPTHGLCESDSEDEVEMIDGHREKIPDKNNPKLHFTGDAKIRRPEDHFGMVHLQLSPKEWGDIPEARAKVQLEFDQMLNINFIDLKNVCAYVDVVKTAKKLV